MKRYLPLLGRFLIALIFLMSGLGKLMDPAGTQAYMGQYGMTFTGLLLAGAILLELGGGLSLLLGYRARWAAAALIVFLIPATLVFHTDFAQRAQMIHFMKNLAIIGGLLTVIAYGAGPLSLDARRENASGERSPLGAAPANSPSHMEGAQEVRVSLVRMKKPLSTWTTR